MDYWTPSIIGHSAAIRRILEIARKVGDTDLNVLITGDSGVGKDLVARSLHYHSNRKDSPFLKINCAALPSELLESELFGYEKGAFTGADKVKLGKFELAENGTVFLDEIGELPLYNQASLLQVLQDQRYNRIGGNREVEVHARVIAATNANLDIQMASGNFRSDLYYRLSTITINIPPLRERKEDIALLADYLIQKLREKYNQPSLELSPEMMELFIKYHWPGNVREMENYLKRLTLLGNFEEIEGEIRSHLDRNTSAASLSQDDTEPSRLQEAADLDDVGEIRFPSLKEVREKAARNAERELIERVLEETGWSRKETSRLLRISYRSLLYKMKGLEIDPPGSRRRNHNHSLSNSTTLRES